jgi:hypothetical protein
MYVGHFAIGVAIKSASPKTPALPILLGIGVLDLLDGLFIILGIDRITPDLAAGPYLFFDMIRIDWDHSLLMATITSGLWGLLFIRTRTTALLAGSAAFSHFLADLVVHNADLALYPGSTAHLGFGLWGRLGVASWALEGVFAAILLALAWHQFIGRGVRIRGPCVLLGLMYLQLSPWLSPMKIAAAQSEPYAHIAHAMLVIVGFAIPALLLSRMIDGAERSALRHSTTP